MTFRVLGAIAVLALASCSAAAPEAAPAKAGAEAGVAMAADMQAKMGVKVAALAAAKARAIASVYARVADASPLALLAAEVASARATADASLAEAKRLQRLADADQSASPKAVEAARAQAAADNARATLAEQRVGLEWGPGVAALGVAGRTALLDDIAHGRAALVRIDSTNVALRDVKSIRLRLTRDGAATTATSLGSAITSDPRLQAPASFALVRGPAAATMPGGRVLYGEVEVGAEQNGVAIPRDAIVRMEGAPWVYVPTGADKFERKEITGGQPRDDSWFVAEGFKPGDQIVTEGAGALLAVERGPEEE